MRNDIELRRIVRRSLVDVESADALNDQIRRSLCDVMEWRRSFARRALIERGRSSTRTARCLAGRDTRPAPLGQSD